MLALLIIYGFVITICLIQITRLLRYFLEFIINSLLVLANQQHTQWSTRALSRSLYMVYRSFSLSRNKKKKKNRKPFSGSSQEILILLEIY